MEWRDAVLGALFPIYCVDCSAEGEWWCANCQKKQPVTLQTEELGGDLSYITAFFNFTENTPLAKLIHLFKYQYVAGVAKLWETMVVSAHVEALPGFVCMPVPLYARRERERGYNQASILAGIFSQALQVPYSTHGLERVKQTAQQAKLSRQERFENVADAFAWPGKERVPEKIMLVDDVFTTGATMEACAKALKAAGAKEVYGMVLARG